MKNQKRKNRRLPAALVAGLCLGTQCASAITGTITSDPADAQINNSSGTLTISRLTESYDYVGGTSGVTSSVVYAFQIPAALLTDPAQQFTAASLRVKMGSAPGASMPVNADLYGIGYGATPTVKTADHYQGALDPSATLIQDNFLTAATPAYATVTNNSSSLVAYLNSALAAARSDGLSTAYVFFRLSPDAYIWFQRYLVSMSESGAANAPQLTYTAEAVSGWHTVPLGGGGYVIGMCSDPTGDNVYCRTDVGGAFRWDEDAAAWESMTDKMVPVGTAGASGLLGISALTVDPSIPQRLYLAAGLYTYSNPRGIYASEDGGDTWTQINSTVVVEGNGAFRATGERLAVDPNDSNTLWFGSIQEGLLKGTRSGGGTWSWSVVPPTSVPFGTSKAGITFVACDTNGGSTITYAGVYDNAGTTGGVYVTTNGSTWTKVGGDTLATPSRGRIAADGTLYVTGGTKVGKIPRGGSLSLLTGLPASTNFGALATDLNDPTGQTVYVAESSSARFSKIFRTTNGGTTWSTQFQNINSGNQARREPDGTPSLTGYWFGSIGALLVNPTHSHELWAGDFFGGYRTLDAAQLGTTGGCFWYNLQKGIEETVPHVLKSPPTGAKLLTGLADVNGFRYTDTTKRPSVANGGNTFSNPSEGSTIGMDFSEGEQNVLARTWVAGNHGYGTGATSTDGGATWMKFGQLAQKTVVSSSTTSGWESWDVGTYLASQKAKGATEVTLAVLAGNSITPLYSNNSINFDSREAADPALWPKLTINGSTVLNPTADAFVANGATSTNYGTATSLQVSYNFGNAPYSRWSYLKFDLTSLGTITSATLELNRRTGSNHSAGIGIYAVTGTAWTETGVTWANKPLTRASDGDPIATPKQSVMGGRIAVSSTDSKKIVWLPEGTGNRARYSTDRGTTWTVCTTGSYSQMQSQFAPGIVINQLTADRVNGKFYLANFNNTHTIYASTDGGATFAQVGTVNGAAYNVYRAQLVAAPAADDVWLSDDGVDTANGGGLWRSTNGGVNWTKLSGLTKVSQVTFGKAVSGSGYTVFINGKKDGVKTVYRSDNYGTSWTALPELPTIAPIDTMTGDRQNYGRVYIGVHGRGVYQGQ